MGVTSWHYPTEPRNPNSAERTVGYAISRTASEAGGGGGGAADEQEAASSRRTGGREWSRTTGFAVVLRPDARSNRARVTTLSAAWVNGVRTAAAFGRRTTPNQLPRNRNRLGHLRRGDRQPCDLVGEPGEGRGSALER